MILLRQYTGKSLTPARLTSFDSTTNSSFHDDIHFPLNDPLYVDFTHYTEFALRESGLWYARVTADISLADPQSHLVC